MEYFLLLGDSRENCYLIDKSKFGSNRLACRGARLEQRLERRALGSDSRSELISIRSWPLFNAATQSQEPASRSDRPWLAAFQRLRISNGGDACCETFLMGGVLS